MDFRGRERRVSYFLHIIKERTKEKLHNIRIWGNKYITIMFIPHTEKRIFSFHITNFAISFFIFLGLLTAGISIFSAKQTQIFSKEKAKLEQASKSKKFQIYYFKKNTEELEKAVDKLITPLSEIYEILGGDKERLKDMWDLEYARKNFGIFYTMENKDTYYFPKEYLKLDVISAKVHFADNILNVVRSFILQHEDIVYNVPSIWPINGGFITSKFGYRRSPFFGIIEFHPGIDIASPPGTPIYATANGIVEDAGYAGGYGLRVMIRHKYGHYTIYGHCSKIFVKKGDEVKRGDIIALVGSTGLSTGPHLHYEIRLGNESINPLPYCEWSK